MEIINNVSIIPSKPVFSVGELVTEFLQIKSLDLSTKSLKVYNDELAAFVSAFGAATPINLISSALLSSYFSGLRPEKSDGGIFLRYTIIKSFYKWAFTSDPCADPLRLIRVRKPRRDPKAGISPAEVQTLIAGCSGKSAARDRAFFALLFDTGLRREEVRGLKWESIDMRTGAVSVSSDISKGNKFRIVFLGQKALMYLRKYQRAAAAVGAAAPSDPLWILSNGQPASDSCLREIIKKNCKKHGFDYGFHDFRRGCALTMLRNGAGIKDISNFLGHADIKTTEIYLAVDAQDVARTSKLYGALK